MLREIRKVEQEDASSSRPPVKPKVAQQQTGQTLTESDSSTNKLLQQMTELMSRMKTLEQRLESQQATNNSQASVPENTFDNSFREVRVEATEGPGEEILVGAIKIIKTITEVVVLLAGSRLALAAVVLIVVPAMGTRQIRLKTSNFLCCWANRESKYYYF